MSNLCESSISIYKALLNIRDDKYVMPAFQRQFVWSMEQIEKLWDSILLDYPISSFLFWHVDQSNVSSDTSFCNFMRDVKFNSRRESDDTNYDLVSIDAEKTNTAILDGQQRLTSLYISLFGEVKMRPIYSRRSGGSADLTRLLIELNKNKLDIDEEEYNSKKFDIKFYIGKSNPTHFNIKDILLDKYKNKETRDEAIDKEIEFVPANSKEYARNIIETLCQKVYDDKLIRFTEIYDMGQDDALEMFVRFNSGGRPLKKHEITMSILEAYWPTAKTEFGKLLTGPYEGFGTDFIIRTAMMLYGDVVKSDINRRIADDLKNNWDSFKNTLLDLEQLITEMNIDFNRFAGSWNVLLPIVYSMYYNPEYINSLDAIQAYLLRAIVFTYFQSGTTAKLQQIKSRIIEYNYEITLEMLEQMNDLRVTDARIEDVVNAEKGSRVAGEVLYYLSLGWRDKAFKYEQDHLHPFAQFDRTKPPKVSYEDWKKWRLMRNRLPNLHLLEGRSNGAKSDMPLIDYYGQMNNDQKDRFRDTAIIPVDVRFELDNFEDFYTKRKVLVEQKVRELLS